MTSLANLTSAHKKSIASMKTKELKIGKLKIKVRYGLTYLQGNSAPYFSVTGETLRLNKTRWVEDTCGCIHDTILKYFPSLKDLVDLHLSTHEGVPMHCLANGLYYLSDKGRAYLAEHGGKSAEEVAKNHFRCSDDEVATLSELVANGALSDATVMVKGFKDRYLKEAQEAIANHELEIPQFPQEDYKNPLA